MRNRPPSSSFTRVGSRLFLALSFVFLIATAVRAEGDSDLDAFAIGGWYGRAYRSDLTHAFSHCGLDATYANGTTLLLNISRDRKVYLGFINQKWSLGPNDSYDIVLKIDDVWTSGFKAEPRSAEAIGLQISDEVLNRLAGGRVLKLRTARQSYWFKLTKTHAAITRLRRCVDIALADERARMKFNPFVMRPDVDAATRAAATEADGNGISLDYDGMKRLLEDAGLSTFQILDQQISRKLQPQVRYMWTDGQIFGGVFHAVSGFTVDDYAPIVFSMMSKGCKGDFASAGDQTLQNERYEEKSLAWKCTATSGKSSSGAITLLRRNRVTTVFFHSGNLAQFSEISDANRKIQKYFETQFAH